MTSGPTLHIYIGVYHVPANFSKGMSAHEEICAGTGDEAKCVIARLHVLPEVEIGVVEDVSVPVEVVKALRREDHGHIITTIK